jgi:hypothetical protein
MSKNNMPVLLIGAAIFSSVAVSMILLFSPERVEDFTREHNAPQILSALFYLAGVACCVVAIRRKRHTRFAWLWLILCFIFWGEETSWLQHRLGYSVPLVEKHNQQKEFNLHNLKIWTNMKMVNQEGEFQFDLRKLLSAQSLFRLGFFCYFLLLPLILKLPSLRLFANKYGFPQISGLMLICIWAPIVLSFVYAISVEPIYRAGLAETREMVFALFICLYTYDFAFNGNVGRDKGLKYESNL